MNAPALLRLAATLAPADGRDRLAEEWAADLAGCAELGLPRSAVLLGALKAASTARMRLAALAAARLWSSIWTVVVGVLFGGVCAVGDIPVVVVVLVAGATQVPLLRSALRRRRAAAARTRARHAG